MPILGSSRGGGAVAVSSGGSVAFFTDTFEIQPPTPPNPVQNTFDLSYVFSPHSETVSWNGVTLSAGADKDYVYLTNDQVRFNFWLKVKPADLVVARYAISTNPASGIIFSENSVVVSNPLESDYELISVPFRGSVQVFRNDVEIHPSDGFRSGDFDFVYPKTVKLTGVLSQIVHGDVLKFRIATVI